MGLDITAYRQLNPADPQGFDADGEPLAENAVRLFINNDFPDRANDVDGTLAYAFAEEFDFRAGSYGGYNDWRDQLAELAGYPKGKERTDYRCRFTQGAFESDAGPFWELINFADNEGVIGAAIASKLATDFAAFQPMADAHPNAYFRDRYADWRRAFDMAADSGAVNFH